MCHFSIVAVCRQRNICLETPSFLQQCWDTCRNHHIDWDYHWRSPKVFLLSNRTLKFIIFLLINFFHIFFCYQNSLFNAHNSSRSIAERNVWKSRWQIGLIPLIFVISKNGATLRNHGIDSESAFKLLLRAANEWASITLKVNGSKKINKCFMIIVTHLLMHTYF